MMGSRTTWVQSVRGIQSLFGIAVFGLIIYSSFCLLSPIEALINQVR